jgi:hypothetical protein
MVNVENHSNVSAELGGESELERCTGISGVFEVEVEVQERDQVEDSLGSDS